MKNILAATDFSRASRNALNYAAEFAKKNKAKLILFHSYLPPVIVSDVPVIIPFEELEKKAMKALHRIAKSLSLKYGRFLEIEMVCKYGLPLDAIKSFSKERKIDFIVMGMQGAGLIEERLVGSTATELISESKIPVITVGKRIKYKPLKKIVFASDLNEINDKNILNPLKEISELFKSHIYILNVIKDDKTLPTISEAVAGIKLENVLKGYKHSFCSVENKNVADGINAFIKKNKMDLVVMMPRKHSFFKSLFKERETKKVAFHTTVPMLTLQD
ncbi:universal stress protein [Aurantibacillus circumpalustris]|uniref:universal stress protein n=1 Tax=Aurantibacillus circumpalustris TaxID=3036359 RepID=UPI00295C0FB1|nr:universal stress protein [Aurantibacillus circumpalustris]